ncbi:peptidase M4 family protein [Clostridium sporogenes]|uniref:M4 family metallopeptidase n=1 Tax=unclassified Clostridium TaxID=2614128 RepID=UPI0013D6C061|nr:peptidase M4 family protein [Clostridium sporogenes]NFS27071.1 peptidase M4 family protein [Clostridium sporogenes]
MKSKKLLTILLSVIITASSISSVYAAGPVGIKNKYQPKTTTIFWEKDKQNNKKSATNIASEKFNNFEEINQFFQQNISRFGLKKGSLKSTKTLKDEKGKTHYHTIYQVDSIPVYYGRIVFTTETDSTISSINGGVDISFENENWKNKIKLSKSDAIAKAKNNIKYKELHDSKADLADLYLYNFEGKPYVVYLVDLRTDTGDWNIFVNAEDGSIVNKFNNTPTLTNTRDKKFISTKKTNTKVNKSNNLIDVQGNTIKGKGKSSLNGIVDIDLTYKDGKCYLKNSNKNIYVYDINNKYIGYTKSDLLRASSIVENNSNEFTDDKHIIAVDTYINLGKTYDYYKDKFNRNSIDNKGMKVEAFIDYNAVGDAAWSEEFNSMFFGNGDGKDFAHMSKALDVVGHEFSHGVTHKESNLKYENESGALNESFSDIMGIAIKGTNFKLGEDCWKPNTEEAGIRDMQDPSKKYQPAHMKDYRYIDIFYDNGGVHLNSGIINHAAYLIADGIEKLGVENSKDIMAKLFYTANCYEWDETTNFSKCRNDLIKVTKDLYGENSKYVQIVENAFDQVGITATPQLPL